MESVFIGHTGPYGHTEVRGVKGWRVFREVFNTRLRLENVSLRVVVINLRVVADVGPSLTY